MKRFLAVALGTGLLIGSALADEKGASQPAPELKDLKQKVSYGIGLSIGKSMKGQSVDVDADIVARGIKDAIAGSKPLLSDQELQQAMLAFQKELQSRQREMAPKQAAASRAEAEKNKKEGAAFLAENAKKPGVKKLPSGLQYKVIKEGTGPTPKATDQVSANYRGTLIDGTEFDSSAKSGRPLQIGVNEVIPGWTEALQLMKVGSKWQLFIPAELAYGANPRPGGPIGPNATLVFELELLGIEK
jgi:FKBP-type peptidyl-prolyl cis-trans isomerase FklB